MSELQEYGKAIRIDDWRDEWEGYIRGAGVAETMLEYGKRWYEFKQWCKEQHGSRGGSMFSEFAQDLFGMSHSLASHWAKIGEHYGELCIIDTKFAPDYNALYDFTRLEPEQKQRLIESLDDGEVIDRKRIKSLTYGHEQGDDWYTPKWIFDELGVQFSIDVCAPVDLTHVTTPADRYFSEIDDGLSQDWEGTIWCNPPYSTPAPWAKRCIEHRDCLLLTHIPMNAEWASDVWQACDGLRLFQAIEFVRPDGKTQRPGQWLMLAAFGDKATDALSKMGAPEEVAANPRRVPSPMWVRA